MQQPAYRGDMATRTYSNEEIEVRWDSSKCIHTGRCLQGYPEVFDTSRRPWIMLEDATTADVVRTIETCPSGALLYRRLDGGQDEVPDHPTTVVPWPNGPYYVRGELEIRDRHGELFEAGPRATLCRCGKSENQPFCDNSHRSSGFRSYPRVISDERDRAESPSDISESPQES